MKWSWDQSPEYYFINPIFQIVIKNLTKIGTVKIYHCELKNFD